ncbi:MAG: SusD/RagB family nutrient-binding outer membrane lipoprotein [Bacteroidales bacterium]|nr:SusD/RagB family nutrient-binding outer membrane lipoprotein [Bacteroidales bacterium]
MKKTLFTSLILAAVAALTLASCSRFDDMSKNPYALYDTPSEGFVHPIMFKTQYNLISVFRSSTVLLMQYAVSTNSEVSSRVIDNYNIPEGTTDDVWSALYLQWGNAVSMYDKAVEENNPAMQGVALILKAFLITNITDTYGDVPFTDAGKLVLTDELGQYYTAYDSQKDIYCAVICMLEDANELLGQALADGKIGFSSVCDKTFGGDYDKWRRFGNSLYARVIMRIALKVIEEDGGILELGDDKWEAVSVKTKLGELYASFQSGGGDYPQMRSAADRPLIPFSDQNETEHTPFFTTTSGNWNTVAVSDVLTRRMLDYTTKTDEELGINYYEYKASSVGGHQEDPRYDSWWRKVNGMPVHLLNAQRVKFLDSALHKSQQGNSKIGRMVRGKTADGTPEPSGIWGHVYDLQNADYYPLMQYSELWFIYTEAGARGWISSASGIGAYLDMFKRAITESILEWNPYVTESSSEVSDYVNWCANGEKYSGAPFNSSNAVEAILTQKWLAQFFIGIESWCDYRRTGYPLLRTDGPAAANDHILPTRMRYPSDEQYRNPASYPQALERLGGTDNIKTDVWWASTRESAENRLKGRQ